MPDLLIQFEVEEEVKFQTYGLWMREMFAALQQFTYSLDVLKQEGWLVTEQTSQWYMH